MVVGAAFDGERFDLLFDIVFEDLKVGLSEPRHRPAILARDRDVGRDQSVIRLEFFFLCPGRAVLRGRRDWLRPRRELAGCLVVPPRPVHAALPVVLHLGPRHRRRLRLRGPATEKCTKR